MSDERAARAADPPASEGGSGAPPAPGSANRARSDLTRSYPGRGFVVHWYASRCIHAAACIRTLPGVFDSRRRPWIDLQSPGAEQDAVAIAVLRCPTGALQLEGAGGVAVPATEGEVELRALRDGPYFVRGDVEIRSEDGTLLRRDTRVALCRCGRSRHAPFCDNTHREIGFRAPAVDASVRGPE